MLCVIAQRTLNFPSTISTQCWRKWNVTYTALVWNSLYWQVKMRRYGLSNCGSNIGPYCPGATKLHSIEPPKCSISFAFSPLFMSCIFNDAEGWKNNIDSSCYFLPLDFPSISPPSASPSSPCFGQSLAMCSLHKANIPQVMALYQHFAFFIRVVLRYCIAFAFCNTAWRRYGSQSFNCFS